MSPARTTPLLRSLPCDSSAEQVRLKQRRLPTTEARLWSANLEQRPWHEMNLSLVSERTANMINALSPAVFLDRDGTMMEDCDYCSDPKDVRIFSGVPEALRSLKSRGFKLIVITNQSGIGRGLMTVEQYRAVEAEVLRQLGSDLIDATYFCPDVPGQNSSCRKPAPGMILQAQREQG